MSVSFSFGSYYNPFCWPRYDPYPRYDIFYDAVYYPAAYYTYVPEPAPVIIYEPLPPAPAIPTLDESWYLLKGGLLEEANASFAEIITLSPDNAMAFAGHALTSILLGEALTGIRDMRLAIVLEPDVLRFLPIDEELIVILEDIQRTFVEAVRAQPDDVNALFMVAAIHFALAEDHEAYFAIRKALDRGDVRESTRMLHDVIDATLAQEFGLPEGG